MQGQGDDALRKRLRELANERRRFGYRRLGILLAREGFEVSHKKLLHLYREEGLPEHLGRRINIEEQLIHSPAPLCCCFIQLLRMQALEWTCPVFVPPQVLV